MDLNKAIIVGRVTADPELRTTSNGTSVSNFSIATNRVWYDNNKQKQEEVEFHDIVCWGRQAEVASQFLSKGALTLIEGRIQTRSWQGNDGNKRYRTEIICERLQLGPRPQGGGGGNSQPSNSGRKQQDNQNNQSNQSGNGSDAGDDDMPVIDIENTGDEQGDDIPF